MQASQIWTRLSTTQSVLSHLWPLLVQCQETRVSIADLEDFMTICSAASAPMACFAWRRTVYYAGRLSRRRASPCAGRLQGGAATPCEVRVHPLGTACPLAGGRGAPGGGPRDAGAEMPFEFPIRTDSGGCATSYATAQR